MIASERIRQMEENFWAETNDPTTEEWREDLTAEELALVAQWEDQMEVALGKMAADTRFLCRISKRWL